MFFSTKVYQREVSRNRRATIFENCETTSHRIVLVSHKKIIIPLSFYGFSYNSSRRSSSLAVLTRGVDEERVRLSHSARLKFTHPFFPFHSTEERARERTKGISSGGKRERSRKAKRETARNHREIAGIDDGRARRAK